MFRLFCIVASGRLTRLAHLSFLEDLMKNIFTTLGIFLVFCIVFSGMTGCTSQQAVSNGNTAGGVANKPATNSESKTSIYPPLASGLAEADLELLDGTKTKISERKGKVLLLNIWGIWCAPCRAEMPHLAEMQEKYREQGFEVVGLNIGDADGAPEGVEAIKVFADKMKLNYTLVRSPGAATQQFYNISKQQVVPQTLLVDREGHLRGVFVGGGARVINTMKETVEKTMSEYGS